ncbi:unnamed protein product [Closterium sp. Naga37s-1]|nr:unnamed protein product [Closterium sp. Naga37s-1]
MAHRPERDPTVLLPPGVLAGQHRTGPTGPPPPWGARWPAPHRAHRSSSPLGSSLASTAQDPPVLLPPRELAGQHRTGPTGPPPPWGARWPAPHRTHRSSSPLGSSLASTAQDPPVLLPPGELAGQHRTGPTGPPPPWGARWPAPHRTHRSSSPLGSSLASTAQDPPVLLPTGELAGQHRIGPTGPPPPWGARWPAPHRTHRSSSPLGSSLASTAQDPPVLLPPGELAGQHRTGPTGPPPPWGARWPAPHGSAWGCANFCLWRFRQPAGADCRWTSPWLLHATGDVVATCASGDFDHFGAMSATGATCAAGIFYATCATGDFATRACGVFVATPA